MDDQQSQVFDLRLNKEGANSIRIFARVISGIIVLVFFFTIISSIRHVHLYNEYLKIADKLDGKYDALVSFQFRYLALIDFLILALNVTAIVFTWRFARQMSVSIHANDETIFNRSFRNIVISSIINMIIIIISLLAHSLMLYNQFRIGF